MAESISHERLLHLIHYNPETGFFTWKRTTSNRVKVGTVAGGPMANGYWKINVDGRMYYAHRLAWFYVHAAWPPRWVDHKNRNQTDNSIGNLRLSTASENCGNQKCRINNSSGFKGAHKKRNKFQARIYKEGKGFSLGVFDTPEQAHAAYVAAAERLFGEFARAA